MKGMIPAHTGLQEFVKQIVSLRQVEPALIQEAIVAAENEMMANGIVAVGDISNTLDTLALKAKHNLAYYTFVELYDLDPSRAADKLNAGLENQKAFEQIYHQYSIFIGYSKCYSVHVYIFRKNTNIFKL
jgi:hypothetical protein